MGRSAPGEGRPLGRGPRLALAGLGLGFLPGAPGTWGSLGTALVIGTTLPHAALAVGTTLLLVTGGSLACLCWGGRALRPDGTGDPGWVVADEIAGQALALSAVLPWVAGRPYGSGLVGVVAALLLFRLFDILKPGPIQRLERLPGGLGVLADDLGAGLVAGLLAAIPAALL